MSFRVDIGSLKFHFKQGATAPATLTDPTLYLVKFPECVGDFDPKAKTTDVKAPTAGVNQLIASPITEALPEYTLTFAQVDDNLLNLLLGGPTPVGVTEPASIAVSSNFLNVGWGYMEWYNNGDVLGTPLRIHSGFTCQLVTEGAYSRDPAKPSELKIKVRLTSIRGTFAPPA